MKAYNVKVNPLGWSPESFDIEVIDSASPSAVVEALKEGLDSVYWPLEPKPTGSGWQMEIVITPIEAEGGE